MRSSIASLAYLGFASAFVGLISTGASGQAPILSLWVTGVYELEEVTPGEWTWTSKCGATCPTQNLPVGIAEPGDWWYPSPWYIPEEGKISAVPGQGKV